MVRAPKNRDAAAVRVGEVLSTKDNPLSALLNYANTLTQLESLLTGVAGPELSGHFQVAAVRQDRLILLTPTASWATRLRMQANQLLDGLKGSAYAHLKHIDIRVAPLSREPAEKRVRKQRSVAADLALEHMSRILGKADPPSESGPDGEA
ncbi:MAG TPA: DciA family protein [Xanthomonadales bacterium]|nr:DciA family protein [Xanthomonadales bacterium]